MSKVPQQRNAIASFVDYIRKIFPHMSQRDAEESAKMSGFATLRAAFLGGWKAGWIARKWHEHNKTAKDMESYSATELFVLDHFESIVAAFDSGKYDSVLREFAKHKERVRLQEMVRKFEGFEPEAYAAFSGLFTQAYGAAAGEEAMINTGADSEKLKAAAVKAFDVIDAKKAAKAAGREKYGAKNFGSFADFTKKLLSALAEDAGVSYEEYVKRFKTVAPMVRVSFPFLHKPEGGYGFGPARFFVADDNGKLRETISEAQAAAAMDRFNNPPKREWIDPLKDRQAEKLAVDSGFKPRTIIDKFLGAGVVVYSLGLAIDMLTKHGHTITPMAVAKLSRLIPEIRHLFVDSMLKQRKPSEINMRMLRQWLTENVGRES